MISEASVGLSQNKEKKMGWCFEHTDISEVC